MTKVSIIIKALNEEDNIARAIESALEAVSAFDGEVVLADSASNDQTVEIAKRYPIVVAVLEDPNERSCGIGPQLGLQHSSGEYVYILDGDMVIHKEFIEEGIKLLEKDLTLAGVGGFVQEMNVSNLEFRGRIKRLKEQRVREQKEVVCLGGGGLYRRESLDSVHYMSDRNLHGYEEYDLGVRLLSNGWRLLSLPMASANHHSYSIGTLKLLWHRWRSGSFLGQGELLRAAIAGGYWPKPITDFRAIRYSLAILLWWIGSILVFPFFLNWQSSFGLFLIGPLVIWVAVAYRHKSVPYGLHAMVVWHLNTLGLILGLFHRRRSPTIPIKSQIIRVAGSDASLPSQ